MERIIEFCDVDYRTQCGKLLLQGIQLTVYRGETLVLLGRSGAGKTTLLKLINRLLVPTRGNVLIENIHTTAWDPIHLRRKIGYVIQEVGLFPHFTVEENVGLVPQLKGWKTSKIKERVSELMNLVGLDPKRFGGRYPSELSGGQGQRVGVARALAADPPILLFDEPFGSLDMITRREIQQEFRALQDKLRKTIVFVTHEPREAFLLATRIAVLQDGKIIFVGEPKDVLRSQNSEVKALAACL